MHDVRPSSRKLASVSGKVMGVWTGKSAFVTLASNYRIYRVPWRMAFHRDTNPETCQVIITSTCLPRSMKQFHRSQSGELRENHQYRLSTSVTLSSTAAPNQVFLLRTERDLGTFTSLRARDPASARTQQGPHPYQSVLTTPTPLL